MAHADASQTFPSDIRLILLDRDGVINRESEAFVKHPQEWVALDGALAAIARLQRRYPVAVATNQSGLARGLFDFPELHAIHAKMNAELTAAGGDGVPVFFCPHGPQDGCDCRKPLPGLLEQAMAHFGVEAPQCLFVGDSERDLEAAANAGCHPVLVLTGNGADTASRLRDTQPPRFADLPTFADLAEFADLVVSSN